MRDKEKRDVDFIVTKDNQPWFLVEAKTSDTHPSPHLAYFQKKTGAKHAFQVVKRLPYQDRDCFEQQQPIVVPASTFLSQLP